MEIVEKDRGIPKPRKNEGPLTRHLRLRGTPGVPQIYGFRRIPRNLVGGILGFGVVVLFFWSLAGYSLNFLLGLGVTVAVTALAVWALAKCPIRPQFDQRWHPPRRIEPLDTGGWRSLATELAGTFRGEPLPRISVNRSGIAVRLAFERDGGARTEARAVLPAAVEARMEVFPRRARFHTREDRPTGDAGFDAAFRVASPDPEAPARFLPPRVRRRIEAVVPERVLVEGRSATAWKKGFVRDPEILRGLVEIAGEIAGAGPE